MTKDILVIDNDLSNCKRIKYNLQDEGTTVYYTQSIQEGMHRLMAHNYCLVIIDVFLSENGGLNLISTMRQMKPMPIFVLTRNDTPNHMVDSFANGADEYMSKPYDLEECLVRSQALVRRYVELNHKSQHNYTVLNYENIMINDKHRMVFQDGEEVPLTRKEYELLHTLLSNQDKVITYEQLYENLWNEDYLGDKNSVLCQISRLRKKLFNADIIQSVRDVGYRLKKH